MIAEADRALYLAKASGRNRTVTSRDLRDGPAPLRQSALRAAG